MIPHARNYHEPTRVGGQLDPLTIVNRLVTLRNKVN